MSRLDKRRLPVLGVGMSFRAEIAREICGHLEEFDLLEVIVDNSFSGLLNDAFWEATRRVPFVGHAVNASIGSLEPLDVDYLQQVKAVASRMQCHWLSEHLAFTRCGRVDVGQLMPVQFNRPTVRQIAGNIHEVQDRLGLPFLIENIAYYFTLPGSEMSELDFLLEVLDAADCGLLLDVNNLYANATNHDYDPYAFIDRLPASAVVEIHVAGGEKRNGLYIDTHAHTVNPAVLALLEHAIVHKQPNAVILEREKNIPPMTELIREVRELRQVWIRSGVPG